MATKSKLRGKTMINGNVDEFIDVITYQDAAVMYKGFRYFFNGLCFNEKTKTYKIEIYKEKLKEGSKYEYEFVEDVFSWKSVSKDECLYHLLNDKIFEGKSFYEVESEMHWIDW